MEKGSTISFDTIEDLKHFFKSDTKNHLVSVLNLTSQPTVLVGMDVVAGFYSIFLRYPKNLEKLSQEVKEGVGAPTVTVIPPGRSVRRKTPPQGIEFGVGVLSYPDKRLDIWKAYKRIYLHAVRRRRVVVSD